MPTTTTATARITFAVAGAVLAAACTGTASGTSSGTTTATLRTTTPASQQGPAVTTTTGAPGPPPWSVRPVMDRIELQWESLYIDPGAVIVDDAGVIHMFYNGSPDWPAPARVGHAISHDGINWERVAPEGHFDGEGLTWRGISIYASDAVILADGSWAIYFHTIERIQSTVGSRIGVAIAPGPDGPWTVLPDPILEPADAGEWDSAAVLDPSVVAVPGGYLMFYDGHADGSGGDTGRTIGLAESSDGITWQRRGAVLNADQSNWSAAGVYDPNVEWTGDQFVMAYWAALPDPDRGRTDELLGIAISEDGVIWQRDPDPVMSSTTYGIADVLISSTALTDDGLFVYFDALVPAWSSTIWVATTRGGLVTFG